jgi:hypothetical protein
MPLTTPDAAHHASISTPCRNQPPVRLDGLNSRWWMYRRCPWRRNQHPRGQR